MPGVAESPAGEWVRQLTGRTPHPHTPPFSGTLKRLFKEVRGENYTEEQYRVQFTVNIPEVIAKLDRMAEIYSTKVEDTPETMKAEMKAERERLEALRAAKGDYVSPLDLA